MLGPALSLSRKTRRQKISHITIGSVNLREEKKGALLSRASRIGTFASRIHVSFCSAISIAVYFARNRYQAASSFQYARKRDKYRRMRGILPRDRPFFPFSSKWKERFERTRQRKQYENGVVAVKRHTRQGTVYLRSARQYLRLLQVSGKPENQGKTIKISETLHRVASGSGTRSF